MSEQQQPERPAEPLSETLRQALDDAMLKHTGRSIGDLASERVIAEIMPLVHAVIERVKIAATTYVADVIEQRDAAREVVRAVAVAKASHGWPSTLTFTTLGAPALRKQARSLLATIEGSPDGDTHAAATE